MGLSPQPGTAQRHFLQSKWPWGQRGVSAFLQPLSQLWGWGALGGITKGRVRTGTDLWPRVHPVLWLQCNPGPERAPEVHWGALCLHPGVGRGTTRLSAGGLGDAENCHPKGRSLRAVQQASLIHRGMDLLQGCRSAGWFPTKAAHSKSP